MTDEKQKLRELIFAKAGKIGSGLDWIVDPKARGQFQIGELERDDNGYFVNVRDSYGDRRSNVYLEENDLRQAEFTDDLETANAFYKNEKLQKEADKLHRRKRIKSGIDRALAIGSILGAMGFLTHKAIESYNAPDMVQARAVAAERKEE